MRFRLGPSTQYTPAPVQTDIPSPTGKPDPAPTTIKGIANDRVTITVPAQDASQTNTIAEVRIYLVAEGQPVLSTGAAYDASPYPFAKLDVTAHTEGSDVVLTAPAVDPVPHHLQVVEAFAQ